MESKKEFKHIVRVGNADLDGNKAIYIALKKIKGVSFMFANALCYFANINKSKITGELSDAETNKLNQLLKAPLNNGFPSWMLNRRKDLETGEDSHLIGVDLKFQKENDIKRLRKIKCFRGVRHGLGLPLRGQRTKSNFRKKKGKGALGVQRKKQVVAPASKKSASAPVKK